MMVLLLSISILAVNFTACKNNDIVPTGDKYTYWATMSVTAAQTLTSYSELLMYQEMEKRTGVEVEFIHPATGSTGAEAFQILLASGDYPDMIEYSWSVYSGGPEQAIKDGVIISLNDYLEDYAPNYYDYLEGEKGKKNHYRYKAQSITNDGNYYGFRNMNVGEYRGFMGFYTRKDLLDKWGLDVPVTIDDWEELFETAKKNGIQYPLTGTQGLFNFKDGDGFNTAYNVGKNFYLVGDKVKFGPFEKQYKEYIKKMSEWVKKGYVDVDYITNGSQELLGAMTNEKSIASMGYVGSAIGRILPAMEERNPEYDLVACPYPVMNEGDVPWFQEVQAEADDVTLCITVDCGEENENRYKEAIKWCDYVYSDEGNILKCFGVEGDTYKVEKGEDGKEHFVYTDKILVNYEDYGAHAIDAALSHFMRPANSPGLNQHNDYLDGFYQYQQQRDALKIWNLYVDEAKLHKLPPLAYTAEEISEKANIEAVAYNDLEAAISNIILGKASIDTYDDAVKKAKNAGYKRILEIQQAAYDRYLSFIK